MRRGRGSGYDGWTLTTNMISVKFFATALQSVLTYFFVNNLLR